MRRYDQNLEATRTYVRWPVLDDSAANEVGGLQVSVGMGMQWRWESRGDGNAVGMGMQWGWDCSGGRNVVGAGMHWGWEKHSVFSSN